MRLVIALAAVLIAGATSQISIASVLARGESVVAVAGGEGEPALEWDIEITGGTASTDHITLVPVAVGVQAEFTVAVDRATAAVMLTTALPAERELASVGCLDDLWPPTEINPVVDDSSFTFHIVPGRRYRCFAASSPIGIGGQAGASAQATQAPTDPLLPRSDASTTSPSAPSPGWPVVLVTLVVIAGIALLLRPVQR
jgi:hypothetical protein